jgi:hypothetical protein
VRAYEAVSFVVRTLSILSNKSLLSLTQQSKSWQTEIRGGLLILVAVQSVGIGPIVRTQAIWD